MNTYTVKDISELLGCSGQTVRNAVKALGLHPKRDSKSRFTFSEEDKGRIVEQISGRNANEPEESELTLELIEVLREQLREKDTQLKEKDAQIEKLLSSLERSNEQIATLLDTNKALSAANAVQIAADKKEKLIEPAVTEPAPAVEEKKGFFARLFGR